MTLSSSYEYKEFVADGLGTPRTIGFELRATDHLKVTADGVAQVLGTHYAITGIYPNQQIVPIAPYWADGAEIAYWRETPRKQEYKIPAGVDLKSATLEGEVDRLGMQQQEQDEDVARAPKVPRGETAPDIEPLATRRGLVALWDTLTGALASVSTAGLAAMLAAPLLTVLPSTFKGDPGSPGEGYTTRTALALAGDEASNLDDAYLTSYPRFGKFVFRSGDWSAQVALDTQQGIYIPRAGQPDGTDGAWVRDYEGPVYPEWFGAFGDFGEDDTIYIRAASAWCESLLSGIERATLALRPAGQYLISGTWTVRGHSIAGNGAAVYAATPFTMLHIKANNQQFDNLYVRFTELQSDPAAIAIKLSENAVGAQASKNLFQSVQTRYAYHGFYNNGGSAANGTIFGSVFTNCRALKNYSWGWYLNAATGCTTVSLFNCQSEGDLDSPEAKGYFLEGSSEWLLANCSADKLPDGDALDVRNAQIVKISGGFAMESCKLKTPGKRLVNISGSRLVDIDQLAVKVPEVDVGAGQKAYYLYVSGGVFLRLFDVYATSETITSGTRVKMRQSNQTRGRLGALDIAEVEFQSNDYLDTYCESDQRGYADSYAGLAAPGTARRQTWNRTPAVGDATYWLDSGAANHGIGVVTASAAEADFKSLAHAINTAGKFPGKQVTDTTSGKEMFAKGAAAADLWTSYTGDLVYTPV